MNYILRLRISSKSPSKAKEELRQIKELWFDGDITEILHLKGFKYIPMILHTCVFIAMEPSEYMSSFSLIHKMNLPYSYFEEIHRLFNLLRQKINVKIKRGVGERSKRTECAFWPEEILDLKEVRDEINRLIAQTLLSKDDPEDRKTVEKLIWHYSFEEGKRMAYDERIDKVMEVLNKKGKKLGEFFSKALEIRTKYPEAKFWFEVEML